MSSATSSFDLAQRYIATALAEAKSQSTVQAELIKFINDTVESSKVSKDRVIAPPAVPQDTRIAKIEELPVIFGREISFMGTVGSLKEQLHYRDFTRDAKGIRYLKDFNGLVSTNDGGHWHGFHIIPQESRMVLVAPKRALIDLPMNCHGVCVHATDIDGNPATVTVEATFSDGSIQVKRYSTEFIGVVAKPGTRLSALALQCDFAVSLKDWATVHSP